MQRLCVIIVLGLLVACEQSDDPYHAYAIGDYATAQQQLEPLAESGDLKAITHLAAIHQIDRDYETAIVLYTSAAQKNDAAAQYNLGVIKHEGLAGEKQLHEAYGWFYLASEQGHENASKQLQLMGNELTPNQIMQAKAWAKEQIIKL